jgi:protein TonB
MEVGAHALEMMDRFAFKRLMPVTASLLIHVGIVGATVLGPGWAPARMPILIAELVEPDAPPAVEPPPPPRPIARDRRPITPPKPIAMPVPSEPPAPVRPEPEPPRPAAPEPPPSATPEPEAPRPVASEPARAPTASPTIAAAGASSGPSVAAAAPDPGPGAFAAPASPTTSPSATTAPTSSARGSAVAAVPGDGPTQRAIPRGGYQYRPPYPSRARNLGVQGTTILHVLVSDTGRVAEVIVTQSAGHPDLDQAASDAVRRWRFEPARRGTEPVEMWVQLPFEFRLR